MSVNIASLCNPAPLATLTKDKARFRATSKVALNEPLPTFTSKTKLLNPEAIFFERIEDVIKGSDSTVPTISRMEYNFLSAGAKLDVCPIMAQPTFLTTPRNVSMLGWVLYPGIESNLSNVPPVCPSPRPEIIGTNNPHAARMGANARLTLSPTPPVECLSHTKSLSKTFCQSSVSPDCVIAFVIQTVSSSDIPLEKIAILIEAI